MGSPDEGASHIPKEHMQKQVTLTFSKFKSQHGQEMRLGGTEATHILYAHEEIKRLEGYLDSVALDPNSLPPYFKIMLPDEGIGYPVLDSSTSLCLAVALAVNISNAVSAHRVAGSIHYQLPGLQAIQVQKIVEMSQELKCLGNQKELSLSVRSAIQELATNLSSTIKVHGDVAYIAEDTISENGPVVFEPTHNELRPSNCTQYMLESETPLNLAFSAFTGTFWVLVSKSVKQDYKNTCKNNLNLKKRISDLDGFHRRQRGAFSKQPRLTMTHKFDSAGGGDKAAQMLEQFHGLCSSLHKIVFEQHKSGGMQLPAFTQNRILRMLAYSRKYSESLSTSFWVLHISTLSTLALPGLPDLDRAIGMVLGLHFFSPASTNYFLCESIALLSNCCPHPESASFHLDDISFCTDVDLLLHSMGPPGSHLAPTVMPAAIAAAAVLAIAMPEEQALFCWKSFDRGMFAQNSMSNGVRSVGCALISLLAYAKLRGERSYSGLESANEVLHNFFDQLHSEDEGVQLLKTSFLRKAWDLDPSSEDIGSIGQILVSLRLVCSNQDLFHCLAIIQHGTPSASIFGLIVGAIIGVSGLEKLSHRPSIHEHHSNQLRAITSMLGNCCKVNFVLFCCLCTF